MCRSMSRGGQTRVSKTRSIPKPNEYIRQLYGEFKSFAFDEERAPELKGHWRKVAFGVDLPIAMDLEIGTGNGYHFAHRALEYPERFLIGLELKYKPLIQTIRRAVKCGCQNAKVARYNAVLVNELFAEEEIDHVFIHFPDPWSKLRQHKHRLLRREFLLRLYAIQRPGSFVDFKTDNREYFDWAMDHIKESPYRIEAQTRDLHRSPYAAENFVTQFEGLFIRQGLPICYVRLRKPL